MYDHLKSLLPVAEQFGDITDVHCSKGCDVWGSRVKISGETATGKRFELELTVREVKEHA